MRDNFVFFCFFVFAQGNNVSFLFLPPPSWPITAKTLLSCGWKSLGVGMEMLSTRRGRTGSFVACLGAYVRAEKSRRRNR